METIEIYDDESNESFSKLIEDGAFNIGKLFATLANQLREREMLYLVIKRLLLECDKDKIVCNPNVMRELLKGIRIKVTWDDAYSDVFTMEMVEEEHAD